MDPPPAAAPPPNQQHQWFCHECQWEGIPVRAPDPICARCQGTFLEEIEPESSDDPRNFDQDDGEGAEAVFEFGDGAQGGPVFRFVLPGGAAALGGGGPTGGGLPGRDAGEAGGAFTGLLNMFGNMINGAGARRQPNGQAQGGEDDPGDPDEELAGGEHGQSGARREAQTQGEGQVPIRNLAAFLGEAFGAPAPHPADHARNNPFAEGGHDDEDDAEPPQGQAHPPNDPFAALAAAAAAGGGGGGLNYLVTLLNAFGGGPLVGNRGDYVFGEGNFQQILNDLMEQAAGRAGPQPATKDIIDNLPRRLVDQEFLDSPANHDCVICQDPYKLDDHLITLPCKFSHAFHTDCIVPWLENSGTCPTCRFPLVPQPVDGVLPAQDAAAGGESAEASGSEARVGEEERQAAESNLSANGATISGGGFVGSLPGSWPVNEAERTRARSRNREREQRERAHEEEDALPWEDLD